MADKVPVKSNKGKVERFTTGDTVPVKHGGTGASDFRHKGYVVGDGNKKLTTIKCEYTQTRDPTPLDDTNGGYSVGSRWINIATRKEWLCVDHKYRKAVWISCCFEDLDATDTFRYWGSLVDFEYDYQQFYWDRRECEDFKDVFKIEYRFGGEPPSTGDIVGIMEIFYNDLWQPIVIKMTYEDDSIKTINLSYDEEDYLTEFIRS